MEYLKVIGIWAVSAAAAMFFSALSINMKIILTVAGICVAALLGAIISATFGRGRVAKILAAIPVPMVFLMMVIGMAAETINGGPL